MGRQCQAKQSTQAQDGDCEFAHPSIYELLEHEKTTDPKLQDLQTNSEKTQGQKWGQGEGARVGTHC